MVTTSEGNFAVSHTVTELWLGDGWAMPGLPWCMGVLGFPLKSGAKMKSFWFARGAERSRLVIGAGAGRAGSGGAMRGGGGPFRLFFCGL